MSESSSGSDCDGTFEVQSTTDRGSRKRKKTGNTKRKAAHTLR